MKGRHVGQGHEKHHRSKLHPPALAGCNLASVVAPIPRRKTAVVSLAKRYATCFDTFDHPLSTSRQGSPSYAKRPCVSDHWGLYHLRDFRRGPSIINAPDAASRSHQRDEEQRGACRSSLGVHRVSAPQAKSMHKPAAASF